MYTQNLLTALGLLAAGAVIVWFRTGYGEPAKTRQGRLRDVCWCTGLLLIVLTGAGAFEPRRFIRWLVRNAWHTSPVGLRSAPDTAYHEGVVTTLSESDATWYDASQHDANFAIAGRYRRCGGTCLTVAGLTKTFGPPAVTYPVGQYLVLVWHKNLLPSSAPCTGAKAGPGRPTAPPSPPPASDPVQHP